MSSMDQSFPTRRIFAKPVLLAAAALTIAPTASDAQTIAVPHAATAQEWDRARANLIARQPGPMRAAISRWEQLNATDRLGFDDYAGFIMAYPGFPQQERLQARAENALGRQDVGAATIAAFFDKHPPLSNAARARYALALANTGRPQAFETARAAWRGGSMDAQTEAYLLGLYGTRLASADHQDRMDMLLWQGDLVAARRQSSFISPAASPLLAARLAMLEGRDPAASGMVVPASALSDPGYVYNLARYYRTSNRLGEATQLLINRQPFARPARDPEDFIAEALRIARSAGARQAQQIAGRLDDLFAPGTDISRESFRLRDDYTSLTWLGGTQALWNLGDGAGAAPLFYRYGAAAQTPQTKSKGYYWAGRAASRAGRQADAARYYGLAAAYPDRFYGMMALKAQGKPMPSLAKPPVAAPSDAEQLAFRRAPLTQAVTEVARNAPWSTGIQFYRTIANNATTPQQHVLVAELAREIGRRDLAVILADAAGADGLDQFVPQGFPTLNAPAGTNWTMVHAITRQESQFAQNAISHAGASGLMQLMPGTAREQAAKSGLTYMSADLISSPDLNVRLGDGYFARMMNYYGGSYPLAVAAYNAGPGNVNKWLRSNGDPRTGGVDWIDWIERIPFSETRNYVHRVVENAAVYEQLYPAKGLVSGKPRTAADFLR